MPAKKYNYTPETDAVIREVYQNTETFRVKSVKIACQRLGWPPGIVKYRAKILGLSRTKEAYWSNEELLLLERWAHQHPKQIRLKFKAAGFLRTESAIAQKYYELKLGSFLDGYSANQLAALFGVDIHVVLRWIDQKWLHAEQCDTNRPDGRGRWFIRHLFVYRFALAHPNDYELGKVKKSWFIDLLSQGKAKWSDNFVLSKQARNNVKPILIREPKAASALIEAVPVEIRKPVTLAQEPDVAKPLSQQQRRVLSMLLAGYRSTVIAQEMKISPKTVHDHKTQLMRKLGVRDNAALFRLAMEQQLIATKEKAS